MASETTTHVTLWTDAERASTAAAVLARMGDLVRPLGVGGPRATEVLELASELGCDYRDDFRQMVVEIPSPFVLVTGVEALEASDLQTAMAQGATVLALEPPASDLQTLAELSGVGGGMSGGGTGASAGGLVVVPEFAQCPGFLHAVEPAGAIGRPRTVVHESVGPASCGSLFARLFDVWRTVLRFAEIPDSVDAALAGSRAPEALPQSLWGLSGAMTCHARMPDGGSAAIHATDEAAVARRWLHVLGTECELSLSDGGYSLWHIQGTLLDEHHPGSGVAYPELVAAHWRRLVERRESALPEQALVNSSTVAQTLACCLACLLSARTGQPESPGRLLEINR